ncbi:hypothetical protein GLAREA_09386 [Glarea lozoyensis ATCC 20868]|uniref:Secreted protein n=1 Tax=Glarea lozoyensis (strain ATCC 20868 / MF5171) TaxID=1116229 RepID=S3D8E0_GLAL2|nr:uncharacterized protein GLAREA_09386 [Glarea lozoyensis ATCC 20868]EPE28266.1 hypothetical protein GLAREA_09386 [Glarea lozoyensis ATCC 20868]
MILTTIFSHLAVLALLPYITALAVSGSNSLPYAVTPWTFKGEIDGSIAAYQTLHPEFNLTAYFEAPNIAHLPSLSPRNKANILCCADAGNELANPHLNWTPANPWEIDSGAQYLQTIDLCHTGPRQCNRISCSYKAAIFLCNDNDYDISPKCAYIASYALDLFNSCRYVKDTILGVCGQEFDTDNYNVVVRAAKC